MLRSAGDLPHEAGDSKSHSDKVCLSSFSGEFSYSSASFTKVVWPGPSLSSFDLFGVVASMSDPWSNLKLLKSVRSNTSLISDTR